MISKLKLQNIGPVPSLAAEFGERLNIITGDNGLGKTFLLDACWYALTRTWAGSDARAFYPSDDLPKSSTPASMEASLFGIQQETIGMMTRHHRHVLQHTILLMSMFGTASNREKGAEKIIFAMA
jgi:predicted ATPase